MARPVDDSVLDLEHEPTTEFRAAVLAGDKATARTALETLTRNWHTADSRVRGELAPLALAVGRLP